MVAGVAGVLDVGVRVSKKLSKVRQTWINADDELVTLQNDLSDLAVLLHRTQGVWEKTQQAIDTNDVASSLQQSTKRANDILRILEEFVDAMSTKTQTQRKRAWVRRKSAVEAKRLELREVRSKIREVLRVCEA